ncbi:MAG: hypothetical protein P0S95_06655 [Rhabdochlamydiaceae bacterium]|nr:hypothetical protein [Candidatus Amphrikana amoebophyrae]
MDVKCPTIGIDLLGGENSPKSILSGLVSLFGEIQSELQLVFFITPDCIEHYQNQLDSLNDSPYIKIIFHSVVEWIDLEDHPVTAVKSKKESSMHGGIHSLKMKEIDAFISIGNTGALLILSKIELNPIKGISRPALLAMMPTRLGPVAVVDVGANLTCKPNQFVEFAEMGVAFQKTRGIEKPRVGILNIGSEELKGTQEIRNARTHIATKAKESPDRIPQFLGNVESHAVFEGEVDVLVTEGFAGNIFLKTAEATSAFLIHEIKNRTPKKKSELEKVTTELESQFCHEAYPGALLIGCDGIVIKCHSYSDSRAIMNAIIESVRLIQEKLIEKISLQL